MHAQPSFMMVATSSAISGVGTGRRLSNKLLKGRVCTCDGSMDSVADDADEDDPNGEEDERELIISQG